MPNQTARHSHRRLRARRRVATLVVAAVILVTGLMVTADGRSSQPSKLRLVAAGRTVATLAVRRPNGRRRPADALAGDVRRLLPPTLEVSRGSVRLSLAVSREATSRVVERAAGRERTAGVVTRAIASAIPAPVIGQELRNNCETAALQVLLQTLGIRVDQLQLQRQLRHDGPVDPQGSAPDQVWGDPELGYVGRADGSGPAGGFGVYQRPVARLARRLGARLDDLTGAPVDRIYERILDGRAVMAWVGLDDGPYGSWRSSAGRPVRVNLNEHTVVLTGFNRDGSLSVVNVLDGTREVWSKTLFEERFARLGRRALAAAPRRG